MDDDQHKDIHEQANEIVLWASQAQEGTLLFDRPLTDLGNAERLVDRQGKDIRYVYLWHKWLVYDGTRWVPDTAGQVYNWMEAVVRGIAQEAERAAPLSNDEFKALMAWAKASESRSRIESGIALARSKVALQPEQLDRHPMVLNCVNGSVDLTTGELRAHRREDLVTQSTGVAYRPEARCPRFRRFLLEIMGGNRHLVRYLQRSLGYAITGNVSERTLSVWWGGGHNGKSTLVKAAAAAGDYAMQAVSDLLLAKHHEAHPTERADLFRKRFVPSCSCSPPTSLSSSPSTATSARSTRSSMGASTRSASTCAASPSKAPRPPPSTWSCSTG